MSNAAPKPPRTKSVALAVILNATPLVVFGIGYLYIGQWKRFLIVECLQFITVTSTVVWGVARFNGVYSVGLLWTVSVIDVLIQAMKYNEGTLKPA
jgi:hypothetical protein